MRGHQPVYEAEVVIPDDFRTDYHILYATKFQSEEVSRQEQIDELAKAEFGANAVSVISVLRKIKDIRAARRIIRKNALEAKGMEVGKWF
jgi:hypothetical protein